ncbi:hypothetical protein ABZ330_30950 [Streptomyces sp. NPDC006172]|uniref:hypothetical protein n=1 Tax=Streptomyces sp. NPDC006172 TaxID=3154470 RepID=UPI0033F2C33B
MTVLLLRCEMRFQNCPGRGGGKIGRDGPARLDQGDGDLEIGEPLGDDLCGLVTVQEVQ